MTIAACTDAQPVTGIVVFNAVEFKASFPSFVTLADPLLQIAFDLATLLLDNSCSSIVQDATKRQSFLYLLTAHIASIQFGENGLPPTGTVGRVAAADQGSVQVDLAWAQEFSAVEAYYIQTRWGALYWRATAQYRVGMYFAPRKRRYAPRDPRLRDWCDEPDQSNGCC